MVKVLVAKFIEKPKGSYIRLRINKTEYLPIIHKFLEESEYFMGSNGLQIPIRTLLGGGMEFTADFGTYVDVLRTISEFNESRSYIIFQ